MSFEGFETDHFRGEASSGGKARTSQTHQQFVDEIFAKTGKKVDEWFGCYFLPFSHGRYVSMLLGDGANYFFTATMNGCSFMVSGNPHAPTVAHLNTARPDDGPDVSKAEKKQRYAEMIGQVPSPNAALLSKHKAHAAFQGQSARYKLNEDELDDIDDTDLADDARNLSDLSCSVVGERTEAGWRFYFQRAAVMKTVVQRIEWVARAVPKSAKHALRKRLNMSYKVTPAFTQNDKSGTASAHHVITQCTTLPFNVVAGT